MSAEGVVTPAAGTGLARDRIAIAAIVVVGYVAIVLASTVYPLLSPMAVYGQISVQGQLFHAAAGVLWLGTLLVSLVREPDGRLWKLILVWVALDSTYALTYVHSSIVWTAARALEVAALAVFVHLLLAFPSGRLRDRYDRRVVGFTYVFAGVSTVAVHLVWPGSFACDPQCVENLLAVWPDWEATSWLERVRTLGLVLVVAPLVLGGLWRHWRAASAVGRRALLPLVVAAPLLAATLSLDNASVVLNWTLGVDFFRSAPGRMVTDLVGLVLPAGLFVGTLRSRLSRVRVAGLVVELGRGVPVGGLRDVLARALGDPTLELAFASPSGSGFVDATGGAVRLPTGDAARTVTRLERDGELLGVLVHDPAIEAEDPGLVEAVGNAARLALENERLAAEVRAQLGEVRASRARIVEAADAERRRIERDLHDGAQQRLVALALRLQVAKGTVAGADSLLDEATAELQTAIGEVRGLARGVHPTILTEAGLRAAVEALAERTPLPLTVDVPERRHPPAVEATAYFVIAEGLTNVARHAGATEARVSIREVAGRLVVELTDDGRGGADPAAGSGLSGLTDRLAAAGGTLSVSSPPGGGTILRAELPVHGPGVPTLVSEPSGADARLAHRFPVLAVRAAPGGQPLAGTDRRPGTPHPIRLTIAVGAAIALIAGATAVVGLRERDPDNGRADAFGRPFVFQVPGDSGIRLEPLSENLHVLRVSPDSIEGISIWIAGDLLADPCDPEGDTRPRPTGVSGLLDALRSVDRLRVADVGSTTVDGRPARRIELSVDGAGSGCELEGLALWRDGQANDVVGWIWVGEGERLPLTVLDVEGATVILEIWARERLDEWLPTARSIVDSIRFLNPSPGAGSASGPGP